MVGRQLKRLKHLASLVVDPRGLWAMVRWRPFSITACRMVRAMAGQGLTFRTIIDGGANVGQFARAATEIYPQAAIYSFEPVPECYERLEANLADRRQVRTFGHALGSEDGTLTFYPRAYSQASSFFPDSRGLAGPAAIQVRVVRLDSVIAAGDLEPPVLLKLDLEGYELEALKGAKETLKRTDYALLETCFRKAHAAQCLFSDVLHFMEDAGFAFLRPIQAEPQMGPRCEFVQMDALFARSTTAGVPMASSGIPATPRTPGGDAARRTDTSEWS